MSAPLKRTVELTPEQDAYIEAKVASGEFADPNDVVRDSIDRSRAYDAGVDLWLREAVLPVIEASERDPSRGVALDKAFEAVLKRHRRRTSGG